MNFNDLFLFDLCNGFVCLLCCSTSSKFVYFHEMVLFNHLAKQIIDYFWCVCRGKQKKETFHGDLFLPSLSVGRSLYKGFPNRKCFMCDYVAKGFCCCCFSSTLNRTGKCMVLGKSTKKNGLSVNQV